MQNIRTTIQDLNKKNPAPFSNDIVHNYGTYLRNNEIYLKDDSEHYVVPIPLDQVIDIDQMYGDDSTWGKSGSRMPTHAVRGLSSHWCDWFKLARF